MTSQGDSTPNHRYRGFHKTGYAMAFLPPRSQLKGNHRLVRQFHGPGVERQTDHQDLGFIYGSTTHYQRDGGTRVPSDKMSAEHLKLRKQQQEAEADIQNYQETKSRLQQERVAQKKNDLDMLQKYQPWGKPAAGAPRLTASGSLDARKQRMYPNSGSPLGPFGRPGGGAPLRTSSGWVRTTVEGDPDTRFQKHLRREVDDSLRYREGGKQRGRGRESGVLPRTQSEVERRAEEREKQLKYAKRLEEQRVEAMERKAAEKSNEKSAAVIYYPWGNDGPQRDESGKIQGRRWLVGRDSPNISLLDIGHSGPESRPYLTDIQAQAEQRHRLRQEQGEGKRKATREHAEQAGQMWGGGRTLRTHWEDESRVVRQHEYRDQLQSMMEVKQQQRRKETERDKETERQHVQSFNHQWGRPGGGAPRVNPAGEVDATPKNLTSLLEAHVYTGRSFRRT